MGQYFSLFYYKIYYKNARAHLLVNKIFRLTIQHINFTINYKEKLYTNANKKFKKFIILTTTYFLRKKEYTYYNLL